MVTQRLRAHPNIEIINKEYTDIDKEIPLIIATGPLTSEGLSEEISALIGEEYLYFYDAVAPIVTHESIDFEKVYMASRYDKGEGEYINCPMNKEEYYKFYNALMEAERFPMKKFEEEKVFEACMPVEKLAERGEKTLLFGPMKPKGLINPRTGRQDYAVVQLRQDDKEGKLYNLVGFQTNLKWGEQKRVFSMIPGLENGDFIRYGVMHRNTFVNSTKLLNRDLSLKGHKNIFMAGQITGSEGYVASIATGFMAAVNLYKTMTGNKTVELEDISSTGAIIKYITEEKKNFQPIGPNFGIIRDIGLKIRDKKEKYTKLAERSLEYLETIKEEIIKR
jgi:methylenetetrahydrofolate--tRNA-(uracil-5-)-methyltransferase